jgi:hypothetical protein
VPLLAVEDEVLIGPHVQREMGTDPGELEDEPDEEDRPEPKSFLHAPRVEESRSGCDRPDDEAEPDEHVARAGVVRAPVLDGGLGGDGGECRERENDVGRADSGRDRPGEPPIGRRRGLPNRARGRLRWACHASRLDAYPRSPRRSKTA